MCWLLISLYLLLLHFCCPRSVIWLGNRPRSSLFGVGWGALPSALLLKEEKCREMVEMRKCKQEYKKDNYVEKRTVMFFLNRGDSNIVTKDKKNIIWLLQRQLYPTINDIGIAYMLLGGGKCKKKGINLIILLGKEQ